MSSAKEPSLHPHRMRGRLICALDVPSVDEAMRLVDLLRDEVGMFKVGKQLFVRGGPEIVRRILDRRVNVFLDLKFHDIPRTVAKATCEAVRLGVNMVDLHALGGAAMMRHTVAQVAGVCRQEGLAMPKLLAVTVLTSLNKRDLAQVGVQGSVEDEVMLLARLAHESGMDGIVSSPREVARLRQEFGRRFLIVTPGVRSQTGSREDQKRVTTAEAAVRAGADYLVVGSSIWGAPDPVAVAREITASMEQGLTKPAWRSELLAGNGE